MCSSSDGFMVTMDASTGKLIVTIMMMIMMMIIIIIIVIIDGSYCHQYG